MNGLNYGAVSQWLGGCYRPLLVTHRRPDGDAIGSLVGLALAVRKLGLDPQAALFDPLPARFALFSDSLHWYAWDEARGVLEKDCDAVVLLDTCALSQLEPIAAFLARGPRILVIDHHATRDPIGVRDEDLRLLDDTACATALLVAEWAQAAGIALQGQLATALFTGIATDTGWFRYSNTDGRAMRMASELVSAGVDVGELYQRIYEQEPLAKLKLVAHLLNNLELHADGRLACMYLRPEDFRKAGADPSMTDDLVNEAGRLAGTQVTLLFTQDGDEVRVNLRSKGQLDVAELARRYGGGGHSRAAGVRLAGRWETVVPRFIADCVEAL